MVAITSSYHSPVAVFFLGNQLGSVLIMLPENPTLMYLQILSTLYVVTVVIECLKFVIVVKPVLLMTLLEKR